MDKKKFRLDKFARDSHALPFRVNAEVANGPCLAVLLITTGKLFATHYHYAFYVRKCVS